MVITASKTLFLSALSFVVGIALQSFFMVPQVLAWGFLVVAVGCVAASFFALRFPSGQAKKEAAVIGFCLLALVLGISRMQISQAQADNDALARLNDTSEKITLTGVIVDDPDVRENSQKLTMLIVDTKSKVLVTVGRYPEYGYLDRLQLVGKLKTPAVFDDFSYKDYLKKDSIYSVMDFPAATLVQKGRAQNPVQFFYQGVLWFKHRLKDSIAVQFAPPHSSIVEGMLLGTTSGMDQQTKDKFSATGLTHLMAISGSNVVILSNIMISLLLLMGLWRKQALYVSAGFIWLYVTIAGFPASGVRAAIMASVFLLAQALGRPNTVVRVVMLAGAVMLLHNPMSLRYDIGFQLSFLAVLGIVYGKPLFDDALAQVARNIRSRQPFLRPSFAQGFGRARPKKPSTLAVKAKAVWDIFSVTMAAQLFTLPIIGFNFDNISLVAPITNLLIIPIVDFIMVFGFLAAFLGLFSGVIGFMVSLPAYVLLVYFMKVLDIFSQPWSQITLYNLPWFWLVVYYVFVTALVRWMRRLRLREFIEYAI